MRIELQEHGQAEDVPRLPAAVCHGLASLVKVTDQGVDRTRVQPGAKVGVVRAGDVTVYVEPKVSIAQLLFLVDYARRPAQWRDPLADVAETGDLAATVVDAYTRMTERALSRGVLYGYRSETASLPVLRGRLRLTNQITAKFGASYPLEVSYSEFGPDVVENRVLKAAAGEALRVPRLRSSTRASLARIARQLSTVSLPPNPSQPISWVPTRLNAHYHDALRMAGVILRGSSFAPSPGGLAAFGFVLDMDVVFQDFVCTALGESVSSRAGGSWTAPHQAYLDVAGEIPIRPDFAFLAGGNVVAVADAKYKLGGKRVPSDIYQMVVYCTALGLARGHLVYAEGKPKQVVHEIRRSGVRVVRHALDLSQGRDGLLSAVDAIAAELVDDIARAGALRPPSRKKTTTSAGG